MNWHAHVVAKQANNLLQNTSNYSILVFLFLCSCWITTQCMFVVHQRDFLTTSKLSPKCELLALKGDTASTSKKSWCIQGSGVFQRKIWLCCVCFNLEITRQKRREGHQLFRRVSNGFYYFESFNKNSF